MKKIILLFILTSLLSCKKDNVADIPSYIQIDEIVLNNSTHNITDAWVYINDNLQGVYELPAKFPILEEGKHNLRIKAGIKENGIAGTRISYPFYSSYIIEQLFTAETTISIDPEVNYISSADFFSEDFEGIGMTLEETSMSDTSIIEDYNDENPLISNYGKGVLIDSLITFEITTDILEDLPQQGAPVFLELDYKCNTRFLIGMYVNFPQTVVEKDLLWVTPKDDWNKIYVNLTPTISESVGAEFFKVFISMKRDFTLSENTINFDNLKVVY